MDEVLTGKVIAVSGPIVKAVGLKEIKMYDIAEVGSDRLICEAIRLVDKITIIQVYEDTRR